MKWIIFLAKSKITYYVYKLNVEDKVILGNTKNNKILIIIEGVLIIKKVFPNETKLPVRILERNDIFTYQNNKNQSYYEIEAINKSYIIVLNKKVFKEKNVHETILRTYYKTLNKYEEIIMIMQQKNSKKRIILLILLVFIKFGYINRNQVTISFKLSEKNIALLTNTSLSSVYKTINNLQKINISRRKNKIFGTLIIKKQT